MRYTEIRMSRIAHELLADLDKNSRFWPELRRFRKIALILPAGTQPADQRLVRNCRRHGNQYSAPQSE